MSDDIKKTGGKKRYYIIVPLVLVVVFLGVSALLFQTGTGRSFLKDQIKTALKSSIDGDLEFEITGGSIFGSIVLTDVSLWTKERDFVAAAPEIRASYDLIGILGGRIVVYAIQAEELVFAIENKNGKSTLSGLFLTKENPEPGSNLQIDLSNIVLKKSFFVNFTTSKDKRLFPFSKKIEAATLREMQSKAKGPGKLEGGVGATIVGDIDTAIKVNIDTNGGTNIGIAQLNSKLSIDSFLKVQDLDVSRIALSFFDGNMSLTTGRTKVGKKASTKGLRFQGHFPEKKTEEWFDTHKLEIENLILSRGYLRVLSEFQLNPQLDPSIEFQSRGSLPNRIQYATKIRVANSQIESIGEVAHLLDDAPIRIDSVIDLPFIQASDLLPIDTKIQGRVKLKIDGEFTKPATLNVKGLLTDVDVLDYRFEEAFFAMTLSKGILDIDQFNLTWGDIVGDLSGQIADKGPFDLKFVGDANPNESKDTTSAAIKMAASGTIDWDAQDAKNLLQTLDTKGEWTLGQFAKGPLKVKQSKGEFDVRLANPTTCKAPTKSCYPKNLDVKVLSSGRGLRLKNDYVSQYYLDVDMKSKLTKEVDLETVLSALSGNFNVVVSSAKIGATRMDNTKAEGSIRATGTDRFSYQVDLRSKRLTVDGREVKNLKANASGRVRTTKDKTNLASLTSKGKLNLNAFSDGENQVENLDATFDIKKNGRDIIGDILFGADKSKIADRSFTDLKGKVDLRKNSVFDVTVEGKQPTSKEKDAAKKKVQIAAKGSYRNGFRLDELDLGDGGYVLKNSVNINGNQLAFDDVSIKRKSQEVKINGSVEQGKSQDLKINLSKVQLADISQELDIEAMKPYKGEVNGNIEVAGSASEPTSIFDVSISDFYAGEIGPIDVRVKGRYDAETLSIESMKIDFFKTITLLGDASIPVSIAQNGSMKWHFNRPLSSKQNISSFNAGDLVSQITKSKDLEIVGKAEASFELSGTLDAPFVDTQWTFEDLGANGFIAETPVSLGPFNGNFGAKHQPRKTGDKFTSILRMESSVGRMLFTASSRAEFPKIIKSFLRDSILPEFRDLDFAMGIRTTSFKIEKLQLGPLVDANAEGSLNLSADFRGSLNNPNLGGKITLNGFGWNRYRDFEFYTAFNFHPKALTLGGTRLGWDGAQILNASANIPNPISLFSDTQKLDESPLQFDVDFIPFALKKLSAFDYKFASLSGVLDGNISASGSFRELKFNSKLTVSKVLYGDGKMGDATMDVSLKNNRLALQAALLRPNDNATLDISLPFTQNFSEALTSGTWVTQGNISGHLLAKNTPLGGLMPSSLYKDHVENLKGSIFSDIIIGGSTARPDINGTLKISDGAFTMREYGRRFEDVGMVMNVAKNRIEVESMHAEDGTGSLNGKGFAVIEDWKVKNLQADFDAKRFSIEGFASVPAFISAKANVSGDFSKPSVRSKVKISGLKVVLPINQNSGALATQLDEDIIIIENQSEELSDFSTSKNAVVDRIYAKMNVNIEDGEIVHPIGNVHFLGELDIDLANIGALIYGDLKTTRGKVETFGKVFEVQPGLVSFRGLDPPNPFLDIEAHYKLSRQITDVVGEASSGEARAIVRVTGPALNSKQQFSADPQMSEPDVLYILITDQAPGSAGVGQAEAGLALGAASTGLTGIASMIVGSANRILPDIAKVDVIRVEAGQNEGKVEVGKYLSRKLFVLYRYRFGAEEGESQHEVTFEYRFLPAWILDFQVGDADQGEANILWDIY